MKEITGYTTTWSATSGDDLPFMVSCDGEYRADIVRLICGDTHPESPGVKEEEIDASVNGRYEGEWQEIHAGSYLRVPDHPLLAPESGFTLQAFVYPTTPEKGTQGLLTKWDDGAGYGLFIGDGGDLVFRTGNGDETTVVRTDAPLERKAWYFVAATVDPDDGITLRQEPYTGDQHKLLHPHEDHAVTVETSSFVAPGETDVPLMMGAHAMWTDDEVVGTGCFNGKIDRPRMADRALSASETVSLVDSVPPEVADAVIAAWDLADGITPDGIKNFDHITDAGPNNLHAEAVNLPTRAVTGHNWTGKRHEFPDAPDQYAAIHFHDDDVHDAGWNSDFTWTVPDDLDSGVYAARLRTDDDETYVPFFVRPSEGDDRADIVFLAPTASYLAYANDYLAIDSPLTELVNGHCPILQPEDVFRSEHREYGPSCYDTHADGHGVFYSSRRRPILNILPKYKHVLGSLPSMLWQLNADLHLIDWLEEMGYDYDVVTDGDLHREGADLLDHYNVVMTGTHPEYYTEEMWTAVEAYQNRGGRLMYMGANGFYWIIGFHPDDPEVIEIRKGDTGIRGYNAPPGELCLSFTGSKGGLWRQRGMAPQKLTGVGFCAEGFDRSSYYRRRPDSYEPETEFIFEGVDEEIIGDFGLIGRGAAGLELDRYDEDLGTPSHAHLLATSEDHTDNVVKVTEEILVTAPGRSSGTDTPTVRADMVYYETPNDGAVFSTGSIAWCGSLSHDGYDNNVSRITKNVLDAFAFEETLPGPE